MPRPPQPLGTWSTIWFTGEKGNYVARTRYRDVDGKTRDIERKGVSKGAAKNTLLEALRDRLKPSDDLSGDMRLHRLAALWWEEWSAAKDRPVGTISRYKNTLRKYVTEGIGEWTIREATVTQLDRYIKTITANVGYSTAIVCSVLLTGMLDMAARHGAITVNPMRSVAPVPIPAREIFSYEYDEVGRLRFILDEWDHGVDGSGRRRVSDLADPVDMFLATGRRPGEIFALKWDDIDFAATPPTAEFRGTVVRNLEGKRVIQPKLKGGRGRVHALPPFAVEMLMNRHYRALTDLVFPSSTGTLRIPDNFRVQWHAALEGTEFEGRLPKDFRSTVGTHVNEDHGIDAAREILGHKQAATTERSYLKKSGIAPDVTDTLEKFNVKVRGKRGV